jgi:iron complex transport system ATP-binding protein
VELLSPPAPGAPSRSVEPSLVARNLTVRREDRLVLDDVSLDLAPGRLVAVLGPNGAGKSTLIGALTGTVPLVAGSVQVAGRPLASFARNQLSREIAVVPQSVEVAFGFTVREVVAMGRAPHQGAMLLASPRDHELVEAALARTGLSALAQRPVDALSGGEQRRVAIARTLVQEANVLLLDEPTAFLDIRHARDVYALLRAEITRVKIACLLVVHDPNAAAQYADHVILLREGRVLAAGTVDEVMTYRLLRDLYDADLYVGLNEVDGSRYFVPMRAPDTLAGGLGGVVK